MDMPKTPLGTLIDKLEAVREKRRKLAEQDAKLKAEYDELDEEIKMRLAAEGMDKATGKKATVSISDVVVANVKDWDAFHAFIKKTGYFHLLQRRVSDPAFRELLEQKGEKAMAKFGVEPFVKKNLNLRSVKA